MKRKVLPMLAWLITALVSVVAISACQKKLAAPAKLADVKLETGDGNQEVVFYARFLNDKNESIATEGTLEIQLFQDGQEFFHKKLPVTVDRFEPYGGRGVQFHSLPHMTSGFAFNPRLNKIGWYDHTLKARFWYTGDEKTPLEFTGGYKFQTSLDVQVPALIDLSKKTWTTMTSPLPSTKSQH